MSLAAVLANEQAWHVENCDVFAGCELLPTKVWRADEYDAVAQRSELEPNRDQLRHVVVSRVEGYYPTCLCGSAPLREAIPPLVLEPFAGSGTTIQVARHMGFRAIGFEVNPAYMELQQDRIEKVPRCFQPKKGRTQRRKGAEQRELF